MSPVLLLLSTYLPLHLPHITLEMKFAILPVLASLALGAQAHFRLHYPTPRGPFVADRQPLFCGGYDNVTTNRTTFPLENGFFRITQGHPDWAGSVLISVEPNPNNFDAFKANGEDRYARYWANESLIGNFCIPLDLSEVPGVTDGANVTIQIALTGGDGELYQCADLTVSSAFTVPDDLQATCQNQTREDTGHHGPAESSTTPGAPAGTAAAGAGNSGMGGFEQLSLLKAVGVALVGAAVGVVSL